jgi:flavin-dependent dehydrogenase/SAM-dependent methyltransferase
MSTKFASRSYEAELLDAPDIPKELLFQNLRELDVVNRTLGGHAITLAGIRRLINDKTKTYVIADIGCGGGDALLAIARWAKKNDYQVKLIGVDINADAIAYMKEQCKAYPEISGVACSYESFFEIHQTVDIMHCSLFCHHLTNQQLIELFELINKHTAIGFIINDLQRHWFAYYSIKFLTRVLNGSSLVKNDAPLSVLRGFKRKELEYLLREGKAANASIKWKWAFRYLVVVNKDKKTMMRGEDVTSSGVEKVCELQKQYKLTHLLDSCCAIDKAKAACDRSVTSAHYQVAIIGGGLGGLTLAIQLADAGFSCVLFEKNKYPFHRVCGEYISMESWNFLEGIGVNLSAWELPKINRLHVTSPAGNVMKHTLDLGGFGISRYKLDNELYQLAMQKGVLVMDDCKVQEIKFGDEQFSISSNKGSFTSTVCVGAWGKRSNMDTALSRSFTKRIKKEEKNYVGIKYHVKLQFPADLIELHNFKNGYCGISKIEEGQYCLCYLTAAENLKHYNGDIKKMESEVLMQNPILKSYFTSAAFLFEEPLAISQIRIGYKSAVENNILMLGDAAGNIAPLSGNGMSMAMRSSRMLYELIPAYLNKKIERDELNKQYEVFWKTQFKKRVQLSRRLQKLLKNRSLTTITIAILKHCSFLRKVIVRSTHGKPF